MEYTSGGPRVRRTGSEPHVQSSAEAPQNWPEAETQGVLIGGISEQVNLGVLDRHVSHLEQKSYNLLVPIALPNHKPVMVPSLRTKLLQLDM